MFMWSIWRKIYRAYLNYLTKQIFSKYKILLGNISLLKFYYCLFKLKSIIYLNMLLCLTKLTFMKMLVKSASNWCPPIILVHNGFIARKYLHFSDINQLPYWWNLFTVFETLPIHLQTIYFTNGERFLWILFNWPLLSNSTSNEQIICRFYIANREEQKNILQ